MRNVLFAFLATIVSGCICGGYDGGGNRVYERNGAEMLILCDNGGYVATLTSNMLEGKFTGYSGTIGETGELAFDFVQNEDQTVTTPQLGDSRWTWMNLDTVGLDHANVLCENLETRDWWTAQ